MTIDINTMISITEVTQNFSKVTKVVNEHGIPGYMVIDFSRVGKEKVVNSEEVFAISERLIKQNMEAYEILAK